MRQEAHNTKEQCTVERFYHLLNICFFWQAYCLFELSSNMTINLSFFHLQSAILMILLNASFIYDQRTFSDFSEKIVHKNLAVKYYPTYYSGNLFYSMNIIKPIKTMLGTTPFFFFWSGNPNFKSLQSFW